MLRSMLRNLPLLLLLRKTVVVVGQESVDNPHQNARFVVAAYLPDYRVHSLNLNASALYLTDLILFSVQPHARGFVEGCCLDDSHYVAVKEAKAYKRQVQDDALLRAWVSVGGGGRSAAFPTIVADPKRRARLLQGLVKLSEKHGLDGVDFDWETPQTQQELEQYMKFLLEAQETLRQHGVLVSVTLHPRQFLSPDVYTRVDRLNLMTYDLPGSYHAEYDIVTREIEYFANRGRCPLLKMTLGLPAYARLERNPASVRTFAELMDESEGQAAGTDVWNDYRYDSPSSLQQKVRYARDKGLGGVFLWELGHDKQDIRLAPGGVLLQAISEAAGDSSFRDDFATEL